jgi:hypothetical protein
MLVSGCIDPNFPDFSFPRPLFSQEELPPKPLVREVNKSKSHLEGYGEVRTLYLKGESNNDLPIVHPVAICFIDCTTAVRS